MTVKEICYLCKRLIIAKFYTTKLCKKLLVTGSITIFNILATLHSTIRNCISIENTRKDFLFEQR